jgi:MFS family permease
VSSLPRTVIALGWVSLLTDLSSEMIYPLLPVFLTGVLGAGPAVLGLIEGVAEASASFLKVVSGFWSDRLRKRKPLVLAGYGISSCCRPLIGLATSWVGVLGLRFADRVGKGLRTSPRDALIADTVDSTARGKAFGFQRSMDHAGAVLGPLVAAALLSLGMEIRGVFLLAAVPALAVIGTILLGVREDPRADPAEGAAPAHPEAGKLSPGFLRLLSAVVLFTLGNSADAFLILRLAEVGVPASRVALLWSAHHVVKMASTYFLGQLSDRLGRRPLLLAGWLFYAAVYAGFAFSATPAALTAWFLAYGLYFGLAEPVERAWAADLSSAGVRGRTYGLYHGAAGAAALPASLLFGLLWNAFGAPTAFLAGATMALAASVLLVRVPETPSHQSELGIHN